MPEGTLHIDQFLTTISVQYGNGTMVGEQVLPPVPVVHRSDKYAIYGKESFRHPNTRRAKASEAARVSWSVTEGTYAVDDYALKDFITDQDRGNVDQPLNLEVDTVENVTRLLLLDQEIRIQALLATLTATSAPSTKWDNSGDATKDVLSGVETLVEACGMVPNLAIVPYQVLNALSTNSTILDKIKYTQKGVVTADLLAALWNIDRVVVPTCRYNSAGEGLAESMGFVWPDTVYLAYVAPRPTVRSLTLGCIFRIGNRVAVPYREEKIEATWYEVRQAQDEALIAFDCGLRIPTVLT